MCLVIGKDFVRITRAGEPFVSFQFTHPLMCRAFQDYADRLVKQYKLDRKSLLF